MIGLKKGMCGVFPDSIQIFLPTAAREAERNNRSSVWPTLKQVQQAWYSFFKDFGQNATPGGYSGRIGSCFAVYSNVVE